MDESPPTQTLNDRNGDRISKESIFETCEPSQLNVEILDPCFKEKKTGIIFHFEAVSKSSFSDRDARNALLEDIKKERRAKKIEKMLKIRELHANKEFLHSATSKNVFNMKALNESLPSASEEKKSCIRFSLDKRIKKKNFGRFERMRCIESTYPSELDGTSLPNAETSKSLDDRLREKIFLHSQRQTRKLALEKHKASDGPKERYQCNHSLDFSKPLINHEPDNNKLGEKSLVFEMNVEFPPLLVPSSDSEKNHTTDLLSPGLSVPLNSPTKWKIDGIASSTSVAELRSEIQHRRLNVFREEKRLQILNTYRGVSPENKDVSKCENPPSKQTSSTFPGYVTKLNDQNCRMNGRAAREAQNFTNSQLTLLGSHAKLMEQLLRIRKKVASKKDRSIESYLPSSSMNCDKVIPD